MNYKAYHFKVSPPQPGSEILIAHLSELGFDSFEYKEDGFVAFVNSLLKVNFKPEDYRFEDFNYEFTIQDIPQSNWNQEWEKNFEPVFVDRLLCIRAPFHKSEPDVLHEIVIMPKMSFGTGHHQTTRLMCKAMFEQEFKSKRVLDMGCGTGILAILAHKLGAKEITGIDVDAWSAENSLENCIANNCQEIKIIQGDASALLHEKPFDHVLANINKNILKRDIPLYVEKMNAGALLYLSGFFVTDQDELNEVCTRSGLEFLSDDQAEGWAMMLFLKK
ncbi:MAG: 50S ribosomal protein L11 methyltransferase [Bacteroidia bacterium]|jgi:ribosomal protein L11 methyltransferase|nr:50S ribosomal protein L11 methyltransferase [Bacteroidia bacterium]